MNSRLLDLPFHLQRLISGFDELAAQKLWQTDDIHSKYDLVQSSIRSTVRDLKDNTGILTVAMQSDSGGKVFVDSFFFPMNATTFTADRSPPNIIVDVQFYRRKRPLCKDISWPLERRILEANRPPQVTDTLLCSPEIILEGSASYMNALTEGLISNLYVVENDYSLTTCPKPYVLQGSMANIISTVAKEKGIVINYQPPLLSEISSWRGAFLSSSCKPLHVISTILLPAEIGEEQQSWTFRDNADDFEVVKTIKDSVREIFLSAGRSVSKDHFINTIGDSGSLWHGAV
jgi:hypothetical protein